MRKLKAPFRRSEAVLMLFRTVAVNSGELIYFMINEGLRTGVDPYADNSGALSIAYTCN